MNCEETRKLIHPYLDGELDLVNSLAVEEHLRTCAACTLIYQNNQTVKAAIRSDGLYFTASPALHVRIQKSLRQTEPRPAVQFRWQWIGLAALLVLVIAAGLIASRMLSAPSQPDVLAQAVIGSHVRSLMVGHLTDVASSDQHTVKPWFSGKLDFSPVVTDLASQGFPLIGGRLDYLDNRPVAALVYQYQKHTINLFIWPSTDPPAEPVAITQQGYHLMYWTRGGMTYWAISDAADVELQKFVQLIHNQDPAGP